jgi:hypothetical protein
LEKDGPLGELSRGSERSSPRQFFPDCTVAMFSIAGHSLEI